MLDTFTWPVGPAHDDEKPVATRPPPLAPTAAYAVASTLSGAVTGLALGALAVLADDVMPTWQVALALAPVVLVASVNQARGVMWPLPERRRQVPRRWLFWPRRWVIGAAFGATIGIGWLTYLQHAAAWAAAATLLLAPSITASAACGAIYGATRAAPMVIVRFEDRYNRRRSAWHRLGRPRSFLARVLAPVSLITYTAIALITI
jgi:hypothetical protein